MDEAVQHLYAIIMAGGQGSGLWPLSRRNMPRQFVDIFGIGTMIERTVQRLSGIVPPDHIYIVTSSRGQALVSTLLPGFPMSNVLAEPLGRKTAPCIALATAFVKKRDPDAVTLVVRSDHLVEDNATFEKTIREGVQLALQKKELVTIGIRPDRPETTYGYMQVDIPASQRSLSPGQTTTLHHVRAFAEKPDSRTAQEFVDSGDFFWNSGIFIWHIDVICRELEHWMPDLYRDLLYMYEAIGSSKEQEVIEDVYSWQHPVAIDCGVMEKSESVVMLEGQFGWMDLGNWDDMLSAQQVSSIPDASGRVQNLIEVDTVNTIVHKPSSKAVCLVGVTDLIVVETDDALLICRKGDSRGVRKAVDIMRRNDGMEGYL